MVNPDYANYINSVIHGFTLLAYITFSTLLLKQLKKKYEEYVMKRGYIIYITVVIGVSIIFRICINILNK